MEKAVYLVLAEKCGTRRKTIKFTPQEGKSDLQCLHSAVHAASLKDAHLQFKMKDTMLILQATKTRPSGESFEADIEDDEEVVNGCDIFPLFINLVRGSPVTNEQVVHEQHLITDSSNNTENDCDLFGKIENNMNADNIIIDGIVDIGDVICGDELFSNTTKEDVPEKIKKAGTSPKKVTGKAMKKVASSNCKKKLKKLSPYHTVLSQLPPLSTFLKELDGKAHSCTEKFINFYGNWLKSVIGGNCAGKEYQLVAEGMVMRHPELKDDDDPESKSGYLASSLSMFMRNARVREKKKLKELGLLSSDSPSQSSCKASSSLMEFPSLPANECVSSAEEAHLQKMMQKLKEMPASSGVTTHITLLIKETFVKRRDWIASVPAASGASYITAEFPFLQNAELVLLELSLMKNSDQLQEKLLECVREVALFKSMPCNTEAEKARFLAALYNEYKPRNTQKNMPDCILVKEAGHCLVNDLQTKENEGARLILYFDKNHEGIEELSVAYIVADQTMKIKIKQPSVVKCFLCLLGCYHAWDRTFPAAYKCFLNIFDIYGLGSFSVDLNVSFKTFRRDFKKWRSEQSM